MQERLPHHAFTFNRAKEGRESSVPWNPSAVVADPVYWQYRGASVTGTDALIASSAFAF